MSDPRIKLPLTPGISDEDAALVIPTLAEVDAHNLSDKTAKDKVMCAFSITEGICIPDEDNLGEAEEDCAAGVMLSKGTSYVC